MRIFNKIVVVVLILVALPVGTLFLVRPEATALAMSDVFALVVEQFAAFEELTLMMVALLALPVDLVLLGLLYLELRRKPQQVARVTRVRRGDGEITLEAIHQRIHHHVSRLADVVEVQPDTRVKGGRVLVALDVVTSPHVNVPEKVDEIVQVVRETVTGGMGLKLRRKPAVSIRHVAYSEVSPPTPPAMSTQPVSVPVPQGESGSDAVDDEGQEKKFRLKLPKSSSQPED
jgi:hypothetical protein